MGTLKGPEEDFTVTITDAFVKVEHPARKTETILWSTLREIALYTTAEGPMLPDLFLVLIGDGDGCLIPQGAKGYDEVYDIVSKYEGFDFENVIQASMCTEEKFFPLWKKI
jgi:hypothetical protein